MYHERRNAMGLKLWRIKLGTGLALAAGIAVLATRDGSAQEAADVLIEAPVPMPGKPAISVFNLKANDAQLGIGDVQKRIVALHGGPPDKMHAIREAAKALNEAEGDDARTDAKAKLTELLDEYFEADMERREQELAEVEERVKKLRSTLERRREKKRDILDLYVQVSLNEADGLGLFDSSAFGPPGAPFGLHIQNAPAMVPVVPPVPPRAGVAPAPAQPRRAAGGFGRGGGGRGGFGGGGGFAGGFGRSEEPSSSPREPEDRERERERDRDRERERERENGREHESDLDPVR
jgi:hypothetical protein